MQAAGGHFIFVCKPASHPLIQEYRTGIDLPTLAQPVRRGQQHFVHRYRWLQGVPLRAGGDALTVNGVEIEIVNGRGETTWRNSCITDLPVDRDTVANLAAVLVALNLLACAIHTVCDIADEPGRAARAKPGPRYKLLQTSATSWRR